MTQLAASAHAEANATRLLPRAVLRLFDGVTRAQKIPAQLAEEIRLWIKDEHGADGSSGMMLLDWRSRASAHFSTRPDAIIVLDLTLAVAYLRDRSNDASENAQAVDNDFVWQLIRPALDSDVCSGRCRLSPQGFFAVYLCSLVYTDEPTGERKTDELYRFHVWLPNGGRTDPHYGVHAHQAFAQSWILAGEGADVMYKVEPEADKKRATHAKYRVTQNIRKPSENNERQRPSSTLSNSGEYVIATMDKHAVHYRGRTYTIPSGAYHTSEVPDDRLFATVFLFDSHRGWDEDAPVLGPPAETEHTNMRYQDEVTPQFLREAVDDVRQWEDLVSSVRSHYGCEELDQAQALNEQILDLCNSSPVLRSSPYYKEYPTAMQLTLQDTRKVRDSETAKA